MKWEAATTTNKATPVRPQLQPLGKRLPLLGRRGSLRQIIYSVPRRVGPEYQEKLSNQKSLIQNDNIISSEDLTPRPLKKLRAFLSKLLT